MHDNDLDDDNACVSCPLGTTNEAGDDASGDDTRCETTLCEVDERVEDNACVACAPGATNAAGDVASGADTSCDGAHRPGDVDRDGCVDMDDYDIIAAWYNYPVDPNIPATQDADLDGSGHIDFNDYLILVENWGNGC